MNDGNNGKWESEPYQEFVSGEREFVTSRMNYADQKGYRYEMLPNGTIRIFEPEIDFLLRTRKNQRPPAYESPEHSTSPP